MDSVAQDGEVVKAAALVSFGAAEERDLYAVLPTEAALAVLPGAVQQRAPVFAEITALDREQAFIHRERCEGVLVVPGVFARCTKALEAVSFRLEAFALVQVAGQHTPFDRWVGVYLWDPDGDVVFAVRDLVVVAVIHERLAERRGAVETRNSV